MRQQWSILKARGFQLREMSIVKKEVITLKLKNKMNVNCRVQCDCISGLRSHV